MRGFFFALRPKQVQNELMSKDWFYKVFIKGLVLVLPISLTISVVSWIVIKAETFFGKSVQKLLGDSLYVPGVGILISLAVIFAAGLLVSNFITRRFVAYFLDKFEKFPVIRTIYSPLKDLFMLFGGGSNENMKKVVMVHFQDKGMRIVGLVTRDDFSDVGKGIFTDQVAVYFPMSFMLGGFTAIVDKSQIEEIDIPVDQALRLGVTGWIKSQKEEGFKR